MIKKVDIIGNGKTAQYFLSAFKNAAITTNIWARHPKNSEEKSLSEFKGEAALTLLCIADNAIAEVSAKLPATASIVAHISGSMPLNSLHEKHRERAIFYPLMSLSTSVKTQISEIPFCLEANQDKTLKTLENFASFLGAKHYRVNSQQRPYLHLSAVIAHNFSNHLFHQAYQVCQQEQINFEMLVPLLKQAVANLGTFDPKQLQTGPAVRKDENTLDKHLKLIENKRLTEIYTLLTQSIKDTHEAKL